MVLRLSEIQAIGVIAWIERQKRRRNFRFFAAGVSAPNFARQLQNLHRSALRCQNLLGRITIGSAFCETVSRCHSAFNVLITNPPESSRLSPKVLTVLAANLTFNQGSLV
jgi:hypothetical protein